MSIVYLIILFPLIGFFLLTFLQSSLSKGLSVFVGIGSISLSFLSVLYLDFIFFKSSFAFLEQKMWTWIDCSPFVIDFSFLIDPLALTMATMVISIGLLIHIFSYWYMSLEKEMSRFFAYMNLFIASMLILLLANNLMFMYLGWEIVGVCSYLLIGFYYSSNENGLASKKAFIITRIGDVFLMLSIFLIYNTFHILNFEKLTFILKNQMIADNYLLLSSIAVLLLLGAVSKSAQIPLHTWLVDAMVGPTPASALIHAATMVTVGVFLILRMSYIFVLVPKVLIIVSFIGGITLLIASISALFQTNIKKILAYSTMSQIGYMFMALGVQAWNAAIVHLVSHAIFKALLFLSAGSIIKICNNEQNIFKMKTFGNKLFLPNIAFLIGAFSLVAFPVISLGFYSKEEILLRILDNRHIFLFCIGLLGVFITSLYTFRLIFILFYKKEIKISYKFNNFFHDFPLFILLVLSTFIGIFIIPDLNDFFPNVSNISYFKQVALEIFSSIISIFGIFVSYYIWGNINYSNMCNYQFKSFLKRYANSISKWGFNEFYTMFFIQPFLNISNAMIKDPVKILFKTGCLYFKKFHKILLLSQSGNLKYYMLVTVNSIMLFIIVVLFL